MTYFVYILYSLKDGELYTGSTSNIENRILKHRNGAVKSTKDRRPLVLIYSQTYASRLEAHKREYFLKTNGAIPLKSE